MFELTSLSEVPPEARVIGSSITRGIKNGAVKSRYVLLGFAKGKPAVGGDLFATTPSLSAWRLLMALSNLQARRGPDHLILVGDSTQAFVQADIGTLV